MSGAARHRLLLVEPQSLVRRTIAAVTRELGLAEVHESTSVDAARRMITASHFDGLVIDLDAAGAAIELISLVREGVFPCEKATPIVAMVDVCDASTVLRMKEFEVRRVLLKPFKVKSVIDSVAGLWPADGATGNVPGSPLRAAA